VLSRDQSRGATAADFLPQQHPHHAVDATRDAAAASLVEQYGATGADVLALCPNGTVLVNPSEVALATLSSAFSTPPRH
jgi:thioredoxin reductase (NADPH)